MSKRLKVEMWEETYVTEERVKVNWKQGACCFWTNKLSEQYVMSYSLNLNLILNLRKVNIESIKPFNWNKAEDKCFILWYTSMCEHMQIYGAEFWINKNNPSQI